MPALASRVGVDMSGYSGQPVPAPISVQSPPATQNNNPGLNTYLRCPIPPIWQSNPDSLRQFYQNNVVPQNRIYNPSINQPSGIVQTVQNVTNVTNNNSTVTSVGATQTAGLIANDGSSGDRQFYKTTNPDTTAPTSGYIYYNGNDAPLLVVVSADGGGGGFHGTVYCDSGSSPTTVVARFSRVNAGSSDPNYYPGSVCFVVPPGYYYGISVTSGGAPPVGSSALDSWTEWLLGS